MADARDSFVHLHLHTDRSLLDAMCRPGELVEAVKARGMSAVAVTDHGNLFAWIDFYQRAQKAGIKPILGCEVYVAPGSRTDRNPRGGREGGATHLTLLCENETGFKNLIELSSLAFLEGFYYKPRIDKESLAKYSEGLIGLSGCLNSEFCKNIRFDMHDKARKTADELRSILGKDRFFVELQDHGFQEQRETYREALRIARDMDLPVVGTNDVHYIHKEDAAAHDVLVCLGTGSLQSDENRLRYATDQFYLKTPQEMRAVFHEIPDAVANTLAIADRCNLKLDFGGQHVPVFETPPGRTQMEYVRELVEQGLERRYGKIDGSLRERVEHELATIEKAGFAGYFLIVWDFIRYAREHGIPVGPGRGSAAGSIVAYALAITDVDPLKYDLLFERFLNPGRIEMPDIDVDFCQEKRPRVIEYVREKYGRDNVCQIITYGTLAARGVVRDVGRVLGVPLGDVDKLAKKIPAVLGITLPEAIQQEPELKELYENDPQVKRLFDISKRLEGNSRHASTHAAGVVISDARLRNYVPLYLNKEEVTTQWDMEDLTKIGLLKMDFLGLQTLTILERAVDMIRSVRGETVDLAKIPLDDVKTYQMLARGESTAVFQLESGGMRDLLQKMKPDRFEDLIAILALFRPGPLKSGMVDTYVRCKHGVEKIASMHPLIDPILQETNGVILYQEQVMRIANRMGGFSLAEADALRKAMGKKKPEIIAKYKDQFISGAEKNGVAREAAAKIFELMEFFAGYGFNKSHSTAYAWVTWQTAYLKANFPTETMAAVMSCEMGNTDKIVEYIDECRRLKIAVLPPDVNQSERDFAVVDGAIRFGLGAVKGVGDKAVEAIRAARSGLPGGFRSIYQFCETVDHTHCNRAVLEALIKCGAFDSLAPNRARVFVALDGAIKVAAQRQADRRSGQLSIFGGGAADAFSPSTWPELPDVPEWEESEKLAFEKAALGFYVSGHPLAKHAALLREFSTISTRGADRSQENLEHVIGGMVSGLQARVLQSGKSAGQKWHKFKLVDLDGAVEAVVFPGDADGARDQIQEDAIAFFKGRFDFRREDPSFKLVDVIPLARARETLSASVLVRLQAAGLDDERLAALKEIFTQHPGSCPVFVEIETAEQVRVQMKVGQTLSVAPSDAFVAAIDGLIGPGRVSLKRKGPQPSKFADRPWEKKRPVGAGSGGGE